MDLPSRVRIYEVGPRDGLQNEAISIPTGVKAEFVRALVDAGLREIEVTSFVSARAIPQLADAAALMAGLPDAPAVRFPVLVPNERGLDRALAAGAKAIAVFTAASDAFTEHNMGMSVSASLDAFRPVLSRATAAGLWTRGYVSTALGCPYTGRVEPDRVVEVGLALLESGVDEVCLGDTIGVGVPSGVWAVDDRLARASVPRDRTAWHFHDTRGTALANVMAAMADGIATFDASAGGTGGCPYAPGAAGNLATEDLVYLLDGLGIEHGVSLDGVLAAARIIGEALGRPPTSKLARAAAAARAVSVSGGSARRTASGDRSATQGPPQRPAQ